MRRLAPLAVAIAACSSTPSGTMSLVTGEETDVLTKAPAPTQLIVESVDTAGAVKELKRANLPTDNLDLGELPQDTLASVRVRGVDGAGVVRVWGESLQLQYGALADANMPIFVQRTGELARMPTPLSNPPSDPVLGLMASRYVFVASGTSLSLYDLYDYTLLPAQPALPRAPKSVVIRGTRAMLIDDAGATLVDLAYGTTNEITAPAGGTFGEVAGGKTLRGSDAQYVIGPTRATGAPTQRVLRVANDGTLSFLALSTPRLGAGAAWVDGRGLVVALGASSGAGAEIIAPGAASASALPYPAHATTGASGAAAIDGNRVLVIAGGDAQPYVLDLGCASNCDLAKRGAPMAAALTDAEAASLDATQAFVLGRDATADHAFLVGEGAAREVPLKVGRRGSRSVKLANGSIALVGGAPQIEAYAPVVTAP